MNAVQRREALSRCLTETPCPVSATALAQRFSVSRQIIVGDIALLRAAGANIVSTPRGYLVPREVGGRLRTLVCRHSAAELEPELNIMAVSYTHLSAACSNKIDLSAVQFLA